MNILIGSLVLIFFFIGGFATGYIAAKLEDTEKIRKEIEERNKRK